MTNTNNTRLAIDANYGSSVLVDFVQHSGASHPDGFAWNEEFAIIDVVVGDRHWTLKQRWSLTQVADADAVALAVAKRVSEKGSIDPSLWVEGNLVYGAQGWDEENADA
jgi:hypothetical protein